MKIADGRQKILNLWGGPGSGKSTLAAAVFAELKFAGYNVELVREYAKELCWAGVLGSIPQAAILYAQADRQKILIDEVDLIITDSPILMSTIYGSDVDKATELHYTDFNCMEVFVKRGKPYNPKGRIQTLDEAKEVDAKIRAMPLTFMDVYGTRVGSIALTGVAKNWIEDPTYFTGRFLGG